MIIVKFSKYLYLVLFAILFIFKPEYKSIMNEKQLFLYGSIFLLAVAIHFFRLRREKNWFRLDVLFILGFGIVHFQWPIMLGFSGIVPEWFSRSFSNFLYINYGTWLSTLGGIAWLFGYSFIAETVKKSNTEYFFNYTRLLWVTILFYIMFLLTAGKDFFSGAVYKGTASGSSAEGLSAYFQLFVAISILTLTTFVIMNARNKYNSNVVQWIVGLDKKYLIVAGSYVLVFLLAGDRGGAMQLTFAFLVLFGQLVRPIKLKEFILIVLLGAAVLTLIGLGRSSDSGENILIAGANQAEFTSGYDVTLELANSSRTLYKSLSYVPEFHDYFYGKLWVTNLLSPIPLSQGIYLKLSGDVPHELASSRYITYLVYGLRAPSGEGTTVIADIYLNFGLIGVVFFLFLLGMFFKKVQNELVIQKNYYWLVVATILASGALYFGRGSLFDELRPIIWGVLLAFIFVKQKRLVA